MPNYNKRILVAEPSQVMRRTIRNMLKQSGYVNIYLVETGRGAWEVLKKEKIGLVIADWNLSFLSGLELLERIREDKELTDVSFLLVTTNSKIDLIAEAAERGVDECIVKPFKIDTFKRKIESIFNGKEDPSAVEYHIYKGRKYKIEGKYDEAIKEFEKALKIDPSRAKTYQAIGEVCETQGKEGEAEEKFLNAMILNPKFISAYNSLVIFTKRRKGWMMP